MSYQEVKAAGSGAIVFGFALVFVFLILAAQYESWSLPISVLLGVPFAVFGAMAGLYLARFVSDSYVNNVFAQIGFVTLIGLSAKNAILIVEFAIEGVRKEAMSFRDAALHAARLRFRPIVMTSIAFILGAVPLVTATGAGAHAQNSVGAGIVGGMLGSTCVAVLFVPMFFVVVMGMSHKDKPADPVPVTEES
jgi:multidrug efflux pump subunit AcrB